MPTAHKKNTGSSGGKKKKAGKTMTKKRHHDPNGWEARQEQRDQKERLFVKSVRTFGNDIAAFKIQLTPEKNQNCEILTKTILQACRSAATTAAQKSKKWDSGLLNIFQILTEGETASNRLISQLTTLLGYDPRMAAREPWPTVLGSHINKYHVKPEEALQRYEKAFLQPQSEGDVEEEDITEETQAFWRNGLLLLNCESLLKGQKPTLANEEYADGVDTLNRGLICDRPRSFIVTLGIIPASTFSSSSSREEATTPTTTTLPSTTSGAKKLSSIASRIVHYRHAQWLLSRHLIIPDYGALLVQLLARSNNHQEESISSTSDDCAFGGGGGGGDGCVDVAFAVAMSKILAHCPISAMNGQLPQFTKIIFSPPCFSLGASRSGPERLARFYEKYSPDCLKDQRRMEVMLSRFRSIGNTMFEELENLHGKEPLTIYDVTAGESKNSVSGGGTVRTWKGGPVDPRDVHLHVCQMTCLDGSAWSSHDGCIQAFAAVCTPRCSAFNTVDSQHCLEQFIINCPPESVWSTLSANGECLPYLKADHDFLGRESPDAEQQEQIILSMLRNGFGAEILALARDDTYAAALNTLVLSRYAGVTQIGRTLLSLDSTALIQALVKALPRHFDVNHPEIHKHSTIFNGDCSSAGARFLTLEQCGVSPALTLSNVRHFSEKARARWVPAETGASSNPICASDENEIWPLIARFGKTGYWLRGLSNLPFEDDYDEEEANRANKKSKKSPCEPLRKNAVYSGDRFGQTKTELPDGTIVYIGGSHEDHYDPDFFIYNDIWVYPPGTDLDDLHEYPDWEEVEQDEEDEEEEGEASAATTKAVPPIPTFPQVFIYPLELFQPTDCHAAAYVPSSAVASADGQERKEAEDATKGKGWIYILGCNGYTWEREQQKNDTPVYRLNCLNWRIEKLHCTGKSPGWVWSFASSRLDGGVLSTGTLLLEMGLRSDDDGHGFVYPKTTKGMIPQSVIESHKNKKKGKSGGQDETSKSKTKFYSERERKRAEDEEFEKVCKKFAELEKTSSRAGKDVVESKKDETKKQKKGKQKEDDDPMVYSSVGGTASLDLNTLIWTSTVSILDEDDD